MSADIVERDDDVIIRPATPDDAEAIAAVRVAAWQRTYRGIIPDSYLDNMTIEDSAAKWERILQAATESTVVLVAEYGSQVIGFASGMVLPEVKLGVTGELTAIYVEPLAQRQGVGTDLVRQVAVRLIDAGADGLLVWVLSKNKAAREFYEALGGELLLEQPFEWEDMALEEAAYGWGEMEPLARGVYVH